MNWLEQWNPTKPERCAICKCIIPTNAVYFRAVVDADTEDAEGYDVCAVCRTKQPNEPVIRMEES